MSEVQRFSDEELIRILREMVKDIFIQEYSLSDLTPQTIKKIIGEKAQKYKVDRVQFLEFIVKDLLIETLEKKIQEIREIHFSVKPSDQSEPQNQHGPSD